MYIGLYTVYEKSVICMIAHNTYIFCDFYGNNIFNLRPISEKTIGVKQDLTPHVCGGVR
jgi:hypothetical protein